ncbi:MAG: hypothetical protein KJ944_06390 [Alphaproteobacteria bacterium]|jgi:hypothetical protein|nr:hypothetical protein [Alphaproteobacteria bacterium]MBU1559908.1 hypothetical protein [Alphaproteobacteria bacterium]MBU2302210.1 hypothetical protein [Alphaproteobacteria bacterium]MBU2369490.1 hypothetical protein [Alphaproteobacteria bacterium]
MTIDRRITNGLAWAGVLLVVGVPTADLLSAQFAGPSATVVREQVADIKPVAPIPAPLSQRPAAPVAKPVVEVAVAAPEKPAAPATKPTVRPAAQTADIVDNFLQSGKPLPSYITGGGASAAPVQAAVTPPVRTPIVTTPATEPVAVDPVQVASIGPQKVAPVPMPLSMRPQPVTMPVVAVAPDDIILPPALVRPPASVTADELADWEAGPLSEFLASRQRQGQPAVVVDPEYDADGFFLDQGPNPGRRGDRVIGWQDESFSFFAD